MHEQAWHIALQRLPPMSMNWTHANHLLHGEERFIFADAGYRGADKRPALKDVKADWYRRTPQQSHRVKTPSSYQ